jgi:tetratricopeptide (TPR) repeat protein
MNKAARYFGSRLVIHLVLMTALLGLALYLAETLGFDPSAVVENGKGRWVMLSVLVELPLLLGVGLVFAVFFVTGFRMRESGYLKGAAGIPFAELIPSGIGLISFFTLVIILLSVFIRPAVSMELMSLRLKKDFVSPAGSVVPDSKRLQDAVTLFYKGRYAESLAGLEAFLKHAPYNRMARLYRDRAQEELGKLEVFRRAALHRSGIFQEGLDHFRGGRFYKAAEVFRKILTVEPRHPYAGRFLKLAQEALVSGQRSTVVDAAHKRRIEAYLRQGIDAYNEKRYWESWAVMRDILQLDPYDESAKLYMKRNREMIAGFDFFPEEVLHLERHPAHSPAFLSIGENRFVHAAWFVRKRTFFYLLNAWLIELDGAGGLKRAVFARTGKWIGGSLVLRDTEVHVPEKAGPPAVHKAERITIPGSVLPELLWDGATLLAGGSRLDPVAVNNLVSHFKASGISLVRLKLAFAEVFALPLAAFCAALVLFSRAWQGRHLAVAMDKRILLPVYVFMPVLLYVMLGLGVRLLLGVERVGAAISPLMSWLLPIGAAIICVIAAFSVLYRTARMA